MVLDFSQKKFKFIFEITKDRTVVLRHFSNNKQKDNVKNLQWCQIAEIHLAGENPDDHHGAKHTGNSSVYSLKYVAHKYYENEKGNKLEFTLQDDKMRVIVHYQFYTGISVVRAWTEVENMCNTTIGLEYVSSFGYTGFDDGISDPTDKIQAFIPHNSWKREMRWRENSLSELGFEKSSEFSMKRISASNTGTWSTKEHLPMAAVVNPETKTAYMWQIESSGSWQWEISDMSDMLYFKLSGPTEQENRWYKELQPGEKFESVKAAVVVSEDFESCLENMIAYRRKIVRKNHSDSYLPVIFNDYMNCLWADPTTEKMIPVIDKAAETGAEYYCMDAGWYADGTWWETVGEWQPCGWRFPGGIKEVFDYIKSKGMIPGIWLEIESMGINCPILDEFTDDCFFTRHGKRVIDHGRYQLDFRSKKVRDFATSVVDRVVTEYGVGYIKLDYNIDGGVGTEINSDSFGDGLLEHTRSFFMWKKSIMDKYPDLIIENCASGGLRMDYETLSLHSIQSTSDESNYKRIAVISSNSATGILPEQNAIWSYPLASGDENEASFNMVSSMLNRIHLSGEITKWSDEQFARVKEGIECYKNIRKVIPKFLPFYPLGLNHYANGFLCTGYRAGKECYLAVWRLDSDAETVVIPMEEVKDAEIIYPLKNKYVLDASDNQVKITLPDKFSAVLLKSK